MRPLLALFFFLLPVFAQTATLHSAQVMGGDGVDTVRRVVSDGAGFVYILGSTQSTDFPVTTTIGPESSTMSFVAKIRVEGWSLVWSTVVRGVNASGLALGPDQAVYLAGFTDRPNELPGVEGAFRGSHVTDTSATFVMKLVDDGTRAAYTALITNGQTLRATQIAVDPLGRAVVGSQGYAPSTAGAYRKGVGSYGESYVARLSVDGARLEFGTSLSDVNQPSILAIAVAEDGTVVVGGQTSDYPVALATTPGAYQNRTPGSDDVFVIKLKSDGSDAVFVSVFGGSGSDLAGQIAIGAGGAIFVGGVCETGSDATAEVPFPVTEGAPFPDFAKNSSFVARLNTDGSALVFSTHVSDRESAGLRMVVEGGRLYAAFAGKWTAGFPDLGYGPTASVDLTGVLILGEDGGVAARRVELPAFAPDAFTVVDGALVVAANRSLIDRPVPAELAPIGPLGRDPEKNKLHQTDITMGRFVLDGGEGHSIDMDAGYLLFEPFVSTDVLRKTVNLQSSEEGATFQVFLPMPQSCCTEVVPYTAAPLEGVTPADVTIGLDPTTSPNSSGVSAMLVVGAMGHPSIQMLPLGTRRMDGQILISTPAPLALSAESGLLETEFQVRVAGTSMVTGETVEGAGPVRLDLTATMSSFTLTPTEGTTPLTVKVTAPADAVAPGSAAMVYLPVRVGGYTRKAYLVMTRPGGPVRPVSATILRVAGYVADGTATTNVDVAAEGVSFQVSSVPDGLTVEPMSGTGPARLTVLVDLTQFPTGVTTPVSFAVKIGETVTNIRVDVNVMPRRLFALVGYTGGPAAVCQGLRVGVYLSGLGLGAPNTSWSDVSPAPMEWHGYTFVFRSRVLPIVSADFANWKFEVQIPYDLVPEAGNAPLEFRAADGTVLASDLVYGGEAATALGLLLTMPGERVVWRSDGTVMTAANPAHPGETVLVELVGAGRLDADVEAGRLPGEGEVWKPVAPLTATIGGKAAPVVSAEMSRRLIGVTEVVMEVPRLAAGAYRMGVFAGNSEVYGIPVWVGW